MATYHISGRAVVWNKTVHSGLTENIPTLQEIISAATKEFPGWPLTELEVIPCGDSIILQVRNDMKPSHT